MPKLSKLVVSRWRSLGPEEVTRAVAVSANLVSNLDFVTDWRLQKAYYLAEVWSIEERLCRLSSVDFASWTFGPWSLHVREATELLEEKGILKRIRQPAKQRPEADFLELTKRPKLPEIGSDDGEFVASLSEQIKYLGGEELTKAAKATAPYHETEPRQLIDLDGYLKALKDKHVSLARSPKVAALVAAAKSE